MRGIVFNMYAAGIEERRSFEAADHAIQPETMLRPNAYRLNTMQTG